MDLAQLEEIISLSQSNDPRKAEASNFLNHLRTLDERWTIGLKLFFESQNEIARYFGLSLIRDYLSSRVSIAVLHQSQNVTVRQQIRECMMKWITDLVAYQHVIPQYITNNVVAILTQLVKIDYPEIWSNAFDELLVIGRQNSIGIDIVVRIIVEIEVEIVAYDDRRTRDEVTHNTVIKDTMRAGKTIGDIVIFLCDSIAKQASIASQAESSSNSLASTNGFSQTASRSSSSSSTVKNAIDLADRCLRCLAELIGWIDVSIAIHDYTLSVLYGCLKNATHRKLRYAACACLCELVKKGMDPFIKARVIKTINLVPMLLSVSSELITSKRRSASIVEDGTFVSRQHQNDNDDDDDEEEDSETDFGMLVDSLFEELLGCWVTFEDNAFKESFNPSGTVPLSVGADIAALLTETWNLVLSVFAAKLTSVAVTVLPSLNRYINLMKQQYGNEARVAAGMSHVPGYFVAVTNIKPLLLGIYKQLQHAMDFEFDLSDEDDAEEIESKKEVRKLFVNCCRVVPEACLELISFVLSSLQQPLSQAPFPDVEAALRLVFSFSECGNKIHRWVSEGTFPALLTALHQTDVAYHPHPQVVLVYYELTVRYSKHVPLAFLQAVVGHITSVRGIRHPTHLQLRARAAYFLFKLAESMDGKSSVLLSHVAPFGDLLFNSDMNGANGMLPESAEIHLLESIGLMTSSTHQVQEQQYQQQLMVLTQIASTIVNQIRTTISNPQVIRYADQLGDRIAHRLSCLSSLTKGHNKPVTATKGTTSTATVASTTTTNSTTTITTTAAFTVGGQWFDECCSSILLETISLLPMCANIRAKTIICCHRLLVCVGLSSLAKVGAIMPYLIRHADTADIELVVQLVAQVMIEFEGNSFEFVNHFYADLVTKIFALTESVEETSASTSTTADQATELTEELPQVETDRVSIQKQLLIFINQLLSSQLQQVMLTPERNVSLLQQVLGNILLSMNGGVGKISAVASLPLRKLAIIILTQLVSCWGKATESVPQQLVDSFYNSILFEQALPQLGRMLSLSIAQQHQSFASAMRGSPGAIQIDGITGSPSAAGAASTTPAATANPNNLSLSDATTLAMYSEVGVLLYNAIHFSQTPSATIQYMLTRLFPALGWPELAIAQLISFLQTENMASSSVRDNFKKFLKSTIQWA